jgi:hypothetical protein
MLVSLVNDFNAATNEADRDNIDSLEVLRL